MNIDRAELVKIAQAQQYLLGGKGMEYYGAEQLGEDPSKALSASVSGIPPWVQPPDGHVPFVEAGVVGVGVVGATTVALTFPVPQGYDGVITKIVLTYTGGGFIDGSGDLIWRIYADGTTIKNFNAIDTTLGSAVIPWIVDNIRIYSGQVVRVDINHVANAALGANTAVKLAGYYYPRRGQ